MNYFLIAGEASGDLHASHLMKGLKESDPGAVFRFIGGDLMLEVAGTGLLSHYNKMNFMGYVAVIANLRYISRILSSVKKEIISFNPDAVILVDYAGFNLRIARFASRAGKKVFYYISPKVWAWKKYRIRTLRKYVTRLFVIFPFEKRFFAENGMEVEYLGNPLIDVMAQFRALQSDRQSFLSKHNPDSRPVVALLAGSRRQEIQLCLPVMVAVAKSFPLYQFIVAGAPSVSPELYRSILAGTDIKIVDNETYKLLDIAYAGVITSGTATLETALFGVPQVVLYKTGALTYRIGKLLVHFRFFGLVNLIYGDELVRELLQTDLVKRTREELERLLEDEPYRENIRQGYDTIRQMLGEVGTSRRVAARIIELTGT